jgi:large subunit ribosomal protein L14
MLQKESKFINSDNTGARLLKCINIKGTKKYGSVGDLIGVIVRKFRAKKKLIKKHVYYGLVIMTKYRIYRLEGIYIKSDNNRVLILNRINKQFLGTRIYGPVCKEIRELRDGKKKLLRYEKIVSLTKQII